MTTTKNTNGPGTGARPNKGDSRPATCHSKIPSRILQWLDEQWAAGRTVTVTNKTGRRSYLWTPGRARHTSLGGRAPFRTDDDGRLWMTRGRTRLPIPMSWRFTAARTDATPRRGRRNGTGSAAGERPAETETGRAREAPGPPATDRAGGA